jgi:hypothetical protein
MTTSLKMLSNLDKPTGIPKDKDILSQPTEFSIEKAKENLSSKYVYS